MSGQFPIILSFLNALGASPFEMAVVLLAVLLLFGAQSLPKTLRTLGRWSEQLRQLSREIQKEITDAGEPFDEIRKELKEDFSPHRVLRKRPGASAEEKKEPEPSQSVADKPATPAAERPAEEPAP